MSSALRFRGKTGHSSFFLRYEMLKSGPTASSRLPARRVRWNMPSSLASSPIVLSAVRNYSSCPVMTNRRQQAGQGPSSYHGESLANDLIERVSLRNRKIIEMTFTSVTWSLRVVLLLSLIFVAVEGHSCEGGQSLWGRHGRRRKPLSRAQRIRAKLYADEQCERSCMSAPRAQSRQQLHQTTSLKPSMNVACLCRSMRS